MRLDRFLALYAVGWWSRRSERGRPTIPILMYHSISEGSENHRNPYYRVHTRPAVFQNHMRWLAEHGWKGISLEEALPCLRDGARPSTDRRAVITFDDGFRDVFTEAWPVLRTCGFAATVFLSTGFIGSSPKSFKGIPCLTWNEVRELRHHGIRFGSHTVTHPRLCKMGSDQIKSELCLSKAAIEKELEEPVTTFAYPYAYPEQDRGFVQRFTRLLSACNYICAVTTRIGRAQTGDDLFALKRLPVNSCDDQSLFAAKLRGAYDFMGRAQAAAKKLKYTLRRNLPFATHPET